MTRLRRLASANVTRRGDQTTNVRKWLVWIVFAPGIFTMSWVSWIALRTWSEHPLEAIILALIAVPSLLLLIRMARQRGSQVLPSDPTWSLSAAQFDYIVWIAIGLPVVLIVGLLLLFVGR
jgi:magnesium-transporting ATPase (P-type)